MIPSQRKSSGARRPGRQRAARCLAVAVGAFALTAGLPVHADPALERCLDRLRQQAPQHGVSRADFDRHTAQAQLLEATVKAARNQPEQRIEWWDYIARVVDDERVREGRALLQEEAEALASIARQYQVDPEVVVAIFGIETNYGGQMGSTPVLDAWLTRACTEQRNLWTSNVFASIRLLRDEVVDPATFTGSWSGAFGMTQFIPTSFYELAVDGDGDAEVDLYHSLPDALASAANHLRQRGARWRAGLPAAIEVTLPAALQATLPSDRRTEVFQRNDTRSLNQWRERGVTLATGDWGRLPEAAGARLFAPAGRHGPVFLVTANFDALLQYNQSTRYALAVALLAQELTGQPGLQTAWPTEDPGLSREEVRELQQGLNDAGYDAGPPDGIPGGRTREALALALHDDPSTPVRVGRAALEAVRSLSPASPSTAP